MIHRRTSSTIRMNGNSAGSCDSDYKPSQYQPFPDYFVHSYFSFNLKLIYCVCQNSPVGKLYIVLPPS